MSQIEESIDTENDESMVVSGWGERGIGRDGVPSRDAENVLEL